MTSIIIGKKELEKIKILTKKIVAETVEIKSNKEAKEISLFFKSIHKENNYVLFSEIVLQQEQAIEENFSVSLSDDESDNFISFLSNASEQDDNVEMKISKNTNSIHVSVGNAVLNILSSYRDVEQNGVFLSTVRPFPIISFNKEEFKSQIIDRTRNLTFQNEWIDKKLSGVNLIVSEDNANLFIATKTFHFKAPITKGVFYPESSKPFVHNDGIIFMKESFINDIYSLAEEGEEIKFFLNEPCEEENEEIPYSVTIGKNMLFQVSGFARSKNIINKKKFDEEVSSKIEYSIKVDLDRFKKFFILFKDSEIFSNKVVRIVSKSKKGLYFKSFEEEESKFEYFIENKETKFDIDIVVNFFALSSVVQALNGDEVTIMETSKNNKHFIVSDDSSWFIIGKSIKQD